jgi:hypothetical protein
MKTVEHRVTAQHVGGVEHGLLHAGPLHFTKVPTNPNAAIIVDDC